MPIQRVHQSNFNRGEIDPNLVSRNDLNAYGSALSKARNVLINNQGSVERRPGTVFRADLGATTRLESFIFSGEQEYIFGFQNTALKIYSTNGTLLQTITSCSWTTSQLFDLSMTQQGDTMIICHESFMPQIIKRTGATTFAKSTFAFDTSIDGYRIFQPYFKFADAEVTLDPSSTSAGTITLTASESYFTSSYVGTTIEIEGSEATITGYTSGTVVTATLKKELSVELDPDPLATQQGTTIVKVTQVAHGLANSASVTISGAEDIFDSDGGGITSATINGTYSVTVIDNDHYTINVGGLNLATESVDGGGARVVVKTHAPTRNWKEQVLSDVHGYPKAVAFHEQRLYFAGVTNIPDLIAGSKVGEFFNFDIGESEDADSVQIQIASNEINEIRHLVSGKVLEVLTNTAEFYLKPPVGKPVTPSDIQVIRQSSLGSQRKAKPRLFDGATVFVQNNGKTVREYLFSSSLEEFSSGSISIEANHLIDTPTDSARISSIGNKPEQLFFLVNTDGTLAVYSAQRLQKILGWFLWETDGTIESITTTTDFIYIAVKRNINSADVYYLEQYATTVFDVPTDMTVTKTISGSYQPHGTPLTKGSVSSSSTFIIDGTTAQPLAGETFQFGGSGTVHTIQSSVATGNSNEYAISIDSAVSESDNTALQFVTSRTFTGLNSSPDMRGKVVHATSGSAEGSDVKYYGSATVTSGGVAVFDIPASAIDIGLSNTLQIKTLPVEPQIRTSGGSATLTAYPRKIAKATIELINTYNIKLNGNDVLLNDGQNINNLGVVDSFTGKRDVHFLGYDNEPDIEITQSVPLPIRLLGITSEVYY